ncbi:MAG: RNA polymerase sigma factor [Muribaculaceae bacterium]|nr:RNA polymerase sigma factor [Muribaculaceae bacterium]
MQRHDFEHQARRWRTLALAVSHSCGASDVEADDVAQDVLLKLWLMRDKLKHYRSPEALVTVMSRNLTIDALRRSRHNYGVAAANIVADPSCDPVQQLISTEQEQRLMSLVEALPSRQHAVLVMRQVEHRSYAEIGSLLGIGEASAKTLLSRARKALLQQFMDDKNHSKR